jgi:hypothetical protein
MDALVAVEIISVILSATIAYGIFRYIPRLGEDHTQRIERAEEATRRSNELRRQAEERHMDEFRLVAEGNRLAEERNVALSRRLLQMEKELITLSAYYPHSDRAH